MRVEVDESFTEAVLELLPDGIVWAKPVRNEEAAIIDFQFFYSNKRGDEVTQHPKGSLVGLRVLEDCIPNKDTCRENFNNYLAVYESGEPQEHQFYSAGLDLMVETVRQPFMGGVLSTTRDRKALRAVEKSEQQKTRLLTAIIENSPAGILVYESIRDQAGVIQDFRIKLNNDVVQRLTDFTQEERSQLSLKDILRLHHSEQRFDRYVQTVETGEPFSFEYYYEPLRKWLSYQVVKLDDGLLLILTDITEKKQDERTLKQQIAFTNSLIDASFNGIYSLKAVRNEENIIVDFEYLFANHLIAQFLNLSPEKLVGQRMLKVLPENKSNGFFNLFCAVLQKGEPVREETHFVTTQINRWFEYAIVKMTDDVLVVSLQDITARKESSDKIEEHKNLLDNILQHSPSGITVTEILQDDQGTFFDNRTIVANKTAAEYIGLSLEELLYKRASEIDPKQIESSFFSRCIHTLKTGQSFITEYFFEPANKWMEISVARMDDRHLINVFTDITVLKNAQLEIERSAERLAAVFNNSQSGIFTFTPVKDEQGEVVDFRFVITNPKFASYVGQTPEVLNGQLGSTWFPGYLHNGVFDMYKKTYLTNQQLRSDVHYNVDGHDIFLDLMSTKVGDEVLVTFTDYTDLKRAQQQLEKSIEDLKRSNVNLEEFAYAASHDLKEPIRKVHFFAERLKTSLETQLSEEQKRFFERMEGAAKRMSSLIDDLLSYSQISLRPRSFEEVDMNHLMKVVLEDLDLEIEEKGALIKVENLFTIKGNFRQLQQAFLNLISNALKYSKPNTRAEITINCTRLYGRDLGISLPYKEMQQQYYMVEVIDNGIGFDQKDADRIFNVFQRLHTNVEYRGTGIGLSIVRKVIENHNGFIWAESKLNEGSNFKVLLPID